MTLLVDGKAAFPEILRCIAAAQRSVRVNMFIWRDDAIGNRIAAALLEAADRGVQVDISVDRYGVVLEKAEECKRSFFHNNTCHRLISLDSSDKCCCSRHRRRCCHQDFCIGNSCSKKCIPVHSCCTIVNILCRNHNSVSALFRGN